jgi:hypothetical protein
MLSTTAALFDHDGPFVSLYLESTSEQFDASHQLDTRWKNARRALEGDGADEATLDAVEAVVHGNHAGGATLAVIAAGGDVLVSRHLAALPTADRWRWAPIPWVGPLIDADHAMIPHVVVLTDRVGADVYGITAAGDTVEESVDGDTEHIQRSSPGGWSQRRFQQRAENTWEDNARLAADTVADLAGRIGARAVIVGGDVRAVTYLTEHLPEHLRDLVHPLEGGGREAGLDLDHVADEITRIVDTVAAERTVEVIREFKEENGQHDRAADGPARVIEALQAAVVEDLLVHDDPDDERTAWFGPEPTHLALSRDDLVAGMGVDEPIEGRIVDICIRAAAGTGAQVTIAPKAIVTDGLAAILRHAGTTPETPGAS